MSEIAIFKNEAFGNVRVVMKDGEPWFVASDVARALGYENISRDIQRHCKHAELFKSTETVPLDVPARGLLAIPESDVYRLIMRSHLPAAEAFQDWIMEVVIPSIRKTGSYGIAQVSGVYELGRAMTGILDRLEAIEARNDRLMTKIEGDFPFCSERQGI